MKNKKVVEYKKIYYEMQKKKSYRKTDRFFVVLKANFK